MSALRHCLCLAALAFGLSALPAAAQTGDQVVAPLKGVSALSLYARPYDAKAQGQVPAKDVVFPLPVLEADGDFLKVRLAGREVWVDGAEVNVGKPVAYGCTRDDTRKPAKTASIQGASSGCK